MYLCDFFAPAIVTDNLLRWNHLFTWPITPTESEQLVPGTGAVPDVHGAPSTWLNLRFMKAATPNPKLVRSGPASRLVTSSSTHLLEAVLVPSIIITRIVTGEVSGVDLEETEEISSDTAVKPRPKQGLLFHVPPLSPQFRPELTLRTPNSPRTTRVRISSTA